MTAAPEDDPRRSLNITDMNPPAPPMPEPGPEPPGPPNL
jgi:hypothetical protein